MIERIARVIAPIRHRYCDYGLKRSRVMAVDEMIAQAVLTELSAGDGVQQVDERAANDLLIGPKVGGGDGNTYVLRSPDYKATLAAFARHRSTAAAAERARIVAWLRGQGWETAQCSNLADAIERGEV